MADAEQLKSLRLKAGLDFEVKGEEKVKKIEKDIAGIVNTAKNIPVNFNLNDPGQINDRIQKMMDYVSGLSIPDYTPENALKVMEDLTRDKQYKFVNHNRIFGKYLNKYNSGEDAQVPYERMASTLSILNSMRKNGFSMEIDKLFGAFNADKLIEQFSGIIKKTQEINSLERKLQDEQEKLKLYGGPAQIDAQERIAKAARKGNVGYVSSHEAQEAADEIYGIEIGVKNDKANKALQNMLEIANVYKEIQLKIEDLDSSDSKSLATLEEKYRQMSQLKEVFKRLDEAMGDFSSLSNIDKETVLKGVNEYIGTLEGLPKSENKIQQKINAMFEEYSNSNLESLKNKRDEMIRNWYIDVNRRTQGNADRINSIVDETGQYADDYGERIRLAQEYKNVLDELAAKIKEVMESGDAVPNSASKLGEMFANFRHIAERLEPGAFNFERYFPDFAEIGSELNSYADKFLEGNPKYFENIERLQSLRETIEDFKSSAGTDMELLKSGDIDGNIAKIKELLDLIQSTRENVPVKDIAGFPGIENIDELAGKLEAMSRALSMFGSEDDTLMCIKDAMSEMQQYGAAVPTATDDSIAHLESALKYIEAIRDASQYIDKEKIISVIGQDEYDRYSTPELINQTAEDLKTQIENLRQQAKIAQELKDSLNDPRLSEHFAPADKEGIEQEIEALQRYIDLINKARGEVGLGDGKVASILGQDDLTGYIQKLEAEIEKLDGLKSKFAEGLPNASSSVTEIPFDKSKFASDVTDAANQGLGDVNADGLRDSVADGVKNGIEAGGQNASTGNAGQQTPFDPKQYVSGIESVLEGVFSKSRDVTINTQKISEDVDKALASGFSKTTYEVSLNTEAIKSSMNTAISDGVSMANANSQKTDAQISTDSNIPDVEVSVKPKIPPDFGAQITAQLEGQDAEIKIKPVLQPIDDSQIMDAFNGSSLIRSDGMVRQVTGSTEIDKDSIGTFIDDLNASIRSALTNLKTSEAGIDEEVASHIENIKKGLRRALNNSLNRSVLGSSESGSAEFAESLTSDLRQQIDRSLDNFANGLDIGGKTEEVQQSIRSQIEKIKSAIGDAIKQVSSDVVQIPGGQVGDGGLNIPVVAKIESVDTAALSEMANSLKDNPIPVAVVPDAGGDFGSKVTEQISGQAARIKIEGAFSTQQDGQDLGAQAFKLDMAGIDRMKDEIVEKFQIIYDCSEELARQLSAIPKAFDGIDFSKLNVDEIAKINDAIGNLDIDKLNGFISALKSLSEIALPQFELERLDFTKIKTDGIDPSSISQIAKALKDLQGIATDAINLDKLDFKKLKTNGIDIDKLGLIIDSLWDLSQIENPKIDFGAFDFSKLKTKSIDVNVLKEIASLDFSNLKVLENVDFSKLNTKGINANTISRVLDNTNRTLVSNEDAAMAHPEYAVSDYANKLKELVRQFDNLKIGRNVDTGRLQQAQDVLEKINNLLAEISGKDMMPLINESMLDKIAGMQAKLESAQNSMQNADLAAQNKDVVSLYREAGKVIDDFNKKQADAIRKSGTFTDISQSVEKVCEAIKKAGNAYDALGEKANAAASNAKQVFEGKYGDPKTIGENMSNALHDAMMKGISTDRGRYTENGTNVLDEYQNGLNNIKSQLAELLGKHLDIITKEETADASNYGQELQSLANKLNELNKKGEELRKGSYSSKDYNRFTALQEELATFKSKNPKAVASYDDKIKDIEGVFNKAKSGAIGYGEAVAQVVPKIKQLKAESANAGNTGETFFSSWTSRMKNMGLYLSSFVSFYKIVGTLKSAISTVRSLDTALVDLQKTTTMSTSELDKFYYDANSVAKQMGVTTQQVIEQASSWSRLGYQSAEGTTTMAKVSSQFASISPGMSTDEATSGLVSIMKAFDIEAEDALEGIASKINIVGKILPICCRNAA